MSKQHLDRRTRERFLDGELSPPRAAEARKHVQLCRDCRAQVAAYRALHASLDRLPTPPVPSGFQARILQAMMPRPTEAQLLLRWGSRAYAAAAVVVAAVAAGVLGVSGPGPVAGSVMIGFSRTLKDGLNSLEQVLTGTVSLIKAAGELVPVADALASLARGLETAFVSLNPQVHMLILLTLMLASLVLVWGLSPTRERGVPHVSLSL